MPPHPSRSRAADKEKPCRKERPDAPVPPQKTDKTGAREKNNAERTEQKTRADQLTSLTNIARPAGRGPVFGENERNRRPLVGVVMTSDEEKKQPGHYTDVSSKKTIVNWGQTLNLRMVVVVAAVLAGIAILLFLLSMCSAAVKVTTGGPVGGGPYDILQNRVDEAFSTPGDAGESATVPSAPPSDAARQQEQQEQRQEQQQQSQSETPEQRAQRQIEEERQLLQSEEELRQEQRDQIPSPLPENPPAPANLGPY